MYKGLAKHMIPWLYGRWALPFRITLLLTDLCNLRCISCWRWNVSSGGEISWVSEELSEDKFLNILEEAASLGVKECELSGGGELLLRKKSLHSYNEKN